jgi:hypothetical protein
VNPIKAAIRPIYQAALSQPYVWQMRHSRPAFARVRKRYFAKHPIYQKPNGGDPVLKELLKSGVVVLPGYFDASLIKEIHDEALGAAEKARNGTQPATWSTLSYAADGIYRLRNIEEIIPKAKLIVDDERLVRLANDYLGLPIRARGNYLDYKPDFGKHDDTTTCHMDSWMSQIKIFTLLNDIDALSAPLVYWKRSHLDLPWRRELDYQHFSESYFGSAGICPPHVLRDKSAGENSELEEVTVTGPAGTVVLADTRGFHRASNVFAGYRLEIVQKFTIQL